MSRENNLRDVWEQSYFKKDNYVFYPHEEIIRFTSRYVRKRIGLREFRDVYSFSSMPKILDLGCGIGRHVIYLHEVELEAYGVDLSENAIEFAVHWAKENSMENAEERIVQGDITDLSWQNDYFNFIVSHGVLDSMPFETAKRSIKEAHRVLEKNGSFYCDLVSGDDSKHHREFSGEEIVETNHERGTVQSYFNFSKINELVNHLFSIEECKLIKHENCLTEGYYKRYHLVLKKL